MRSTRAIVTALVIAVVSAVLIFTALTVGLDLLARNDAESGASDPGPRRVPDEVFRAPARIRTTDTSGPAGPVAVAFLGTEVRSGFFGNDPWPWIAISATTGDYRVLSAPHLPSARDGRVAVCPTGDRMAWAWEGGVAIYDTRADETTEVTSGVEGVGRHLRWSADCTQLVFVGSGVRRIDAESGEVDDVPIEPAERQAGTLEWTPDGSAMNYVDGSELVTVRIGSGETSRIDLGMPGVVDIAWHADGARLAAFQATQHGNRLQIFDLSASRLRRETVTTRHLSMQRMIGWCDDRGVAVTGLRFGTGAMESIEQVDVDDGTYTQLTRLPWAGENWVSADTMSVAADTLTQPPADVDQPSWPWDIRSRLVITLLVTMVPLAYYFTLLPRRIRRQISSR